MLKNRIIITLIWITFSLPLFAFKIQTKGVASGPDLTTTKKEAILIARGKMMKENRKIYMFWAERCFPDSKFDFFSIATKSSATSLPSTIKERIYYSRNNKRYTITITITYSESNKEATARFLDSFQKQMTQKEALLIGYDRKKAAEVMKKMLSQW